MKKLTTFMLILLLVTAFVVPTQAKTDLDVSGQVRARSELDARSLDTSETTKQYTFLRTRVNLKATVDSNASVFVQFQDSRTLGAKNSFDKAQSAGLNDSKNVDMHQAYLKIDHLWENGPGAQAGRFEVNFGNQRTFGAVGWHNVSRSWEGTLLWLKRNNFTLTGFALKALEMNDSHANLDFDAFGAHLSLPKANVELFAVLEKNADTVTAGQTKMDRFNLGLFYKRNYQQFDFLLNAVMQSGTMGGVDTKVDTTLGVITTTVTGTETDISAYMATFEAGYNFNGPKKLRLAAGIDISSGGEAGDTDIKTYNNLYYTGHKFRGYMDYFLGSNKEGLVDMMLRASLNPSPGWTLKGDLHLFSSAKDYSYPTDTTNTNFATASDGGMEIDLSLATSKVKGVKLVGGISIFMPEKNFVAAKHYKAGTAAMKSAMTAGDPPVNPAKFAFGKGIQDDMTMWTYLQAIVNF